MSRYQKGKTSLDFTEARDSERQWHQLGHMQVCTSLQTDNHASTPLSVFYRPDAVPATQPTASKHCTVSNPTNSRCTAVNVSASGGLRTLAPLRTPHFPPRYKILAAPLHASMLVCTLARYLTILTVCACADKPGAPENLQASDVFAEHCKLSWNPPTDDGGSEVTGTHDPLHAAVHSRSWFTLLTASKVRLEQP